MSVDERLRRGLEANATSFHPRGEVRLDRLRRRHRRRRAVAVAALTVVLGSGVSAAWFVAVGGDDGAGGPGRGVEPAAPVPTTPTPSATPSATPGATPGATVPDADWRRTVTRSEARALGVGADFLRDNFGDADRLPLVLSLDGAFYSQSGRYPGGWSVGDRGTVSYDARGRLVLTSTGFACSGCTVAVAWRIVGGDLRLEDPDGALAPEERLMVVGSWSRQEQ